MEYTRLSHTDLEISRLGFGCLAMGAHGWGKVDDADSIDSVHRALDLGINFFDTANVYGFGHSEEVLSKALGEKRKHVIIATKFGVTWDEKAQIGRDMSPKSAMSALENSLRRLQLDCIPLYQIHWPNGKTNIEDTLETLMRCQEAGKIRYIGCSNFSPELLREANKTYKIVSTQAPYNLVDRSIENDVLPYCKEINTGVFAYCALAHGLLAGKYSAQRPDFDSEDIRNRSAYFKDAKYETNLKMVEKLQTIGQRYGKTSAQVAVRWILDNPTITCALTGIKRPSQIEDNVGALGWTLSEDDLQTLSGTEIP